MGFRLATSHPERIESLIIQNGNAYEEGLRDFWKPFRSLLERATRTEERQSPQEEFLNLAATKWQYTHGVRNTEVDQSR